MFLFHFSQESPQEGTCRATWKLGLEATPDSPDSSRTSSPHHSRHTCGHLSIPCHQPLAAQNLLSAGRKGNLGPSKCQMSCNGLYTHKDKLHESLCCL